MKKILLFIVFFVAIVSGGFAQTKLPAQLSIGGEFGLPTGQASQAYGSVLGASVKLELPVSNTHFNFLITAGYSAFLTKFNYSGTYKSSLYIPIEAGGKYYFSKIGYVEGDLGLSDDVTGNYSSSKTAFVYAPVIGFSAPTTKHKGTIDIGLRYEGRVAGGNGIGQVALRLAYRFGLK